MPPTNFPLRWESTGDQWWYASPIDWAAANGHYDLVHELLRIDGNHLIKLTSLRRIRRLESVWDNEQQFHDVAKCRSEVARKLLFQSDNKKGNNSLIQAGYGGWLIYTAASAGDLGFVQNLLERNPLLVFGEGEFGVTDILYAAARSKNSEVFRLLFDFAASPRFITGKGSEMEEHIGDIPSVYKWEMINRAIHAAARGGNLKILKELLGDCSDVLAYRDVEGSTILHTAAGRGQVEVLDYLIASFDIVNSTDHQGNTALHVAANRGQLAAVEALISASPSYVCSRNSAGETFLHKAVAGFQTTSFRRLDKQIDLLKHLVCGKIFNIQDIINAKNNEERTALHMSIIGNIHTDLVQLLMKAHSIDVNVQDANGMTPLDYLRQSPQSASSDMLIRKLISAGGIFSCEDYTARKVFASRLKMQSNGSSPGTSFRISDQEIFLYTGMEQNVTSDASVEQGSSGLSTSSVEQSLYDSTNEPHISSMSTKLSSVHYAAERMKRAFHWPKSTEKKTQKFKKSADKNSYVTPTSLRTRYSNATSHPNNKRTLSVRSNQSSPPAKKKFASGLRHGVMQAMPHITVPGRSSRSSSFSKSLISSPTSLDKQKGAYIENGITGPSCFNQVVYDDGTPNVVKQGVVNKKMKSQYLCFGKSGLPVKTHSRQQLSQDYKRPVASVALLS